MKKISTLFLSLAAICAAPGMMAEELVIPTNPANEGIEIIQNGRFDFINNLIGNTSTSTIIDLGEVDFGDGTKYKAASVDFANGWSAKGWAVLRAGSDFKTSEAIAAIPLNKYQTYYIPRHYGANITAYTSDDIKIDDEAVEFIVPEGKQKLYLTFNSCSGNIFAVRLHSDAFTDDDFIEDNDGDWYCSRLRNPNEQLASYEGRYVNLAAADAQPAVPTGEDTDFPEVKIDGNNGWGWTGDGLVMNYGTVDFGENRFTQIAAEIKHWQQNTTHYLEFYLDEATDDNKIASLWVGRDCYDTVFPIATGLHEISGEHDLLVKWVGGGTNVRDISLYEGTPWYEAPDHGENPAKVDEKPIEGSFHYTVENTQDGKGGVWNCEILNEGRFEGAGNVGYTKNGTVLKYTSPDGTGVDFGNNAYMSFVINHACDKDWTDIIKASNFTFYIDLEDWHNIGDAEPIAIVRLQGTGSWGTRMHVRGEFLTKVSGKHDLYMFINTPTTDAGANVFDIYMEPRPYVPAPAVPALTIETNHTNMDNVEIIGAGRFDIEHHLISNTNDKTIISLGEVDFVDGDKYKATSVDFVNGWDTDGYIELCAGSDLETAVPFTKMGINEYRGSYYLPRRYGANMACNITDDESKDDNNEEGEEENEVATQADDDADATVYVKPVGKQKVYLKFVGGNGNLFAVHFYEDELTEHDMVKDGQGDWGGDTGIRLLHPSEDPRLEENRIVILSTDATAAVEGFNAHINTDTNAWGWTGNGFVADYGDVDFGETRFNQIVAFLNRWDKDNNAYIEFYTDEVSESNLIARMWAGRETRDHFYPVVGELAEVEGTHKLLVKWAGSSFDLYSVGLYEGNLWPVSKDLGKTPDMVDELPVEEYEHFTVEGTQNGKGGIWNCEIVNKGQFEGNGNVGYTGNGSILKYTMPDGTGIDFGDDNFKSIVVNHACDKAWTDFINNSNFSFYTDLENTNNIGDAEPIAKVRLQGTGNWGTRKHVRGDITTSVTGKHVLYLVYNTPTTDAGANIFDIYLEYREGKSGIDAITGNGETVIAGIENGIAINVANDTTVAIYNAIGVAVVNTTVKAGNHILTVAPGFYIVKAGNTTAKVVVK